ncbi:MAG: hypothetical protein ACN6N7_06520, partial [Chryseobacterium culicis]
GKTYGSNIDKEQHLEYAVSGSLKKIQYPTGGSMEIEYEGDDYYTTRKLVKFEQKNVTIDSDVAPYYEFSIAGHNIVDSYGGKVTFTSYFSSPVNPENTTLDLPVKSYFEGEIMDTDDNVLANFIFTGSLPLTLDKKDAYRLRIRKVNLRGQAPHINLDDYYATLGLSWTEISTSQITGNYKTGGLRVKKIIKRDENNAVAQSVEYNYNDDEGKSTGNYVGDDVNYIYTSPLQTDPSSNICQITTIGNIGAFNSSTINGKPIVYDRVQTKYIGNQENYKVVDTYSNNRGLNPIVLNPTVFTYFDGKYNLGQIKKKEYFNSLGKLVRSTDFEYENDYYFNKFSNDYIAAEPYLTIKPYSILVSGYHLFINIGSPFPASYRAFYSVERYQISSAWVKQKSILSKTYFNNQELSERKEYFYDPNYKHLSPIKERITYSDNKVNESAFAFAHEKNNQKLITANMVGVPLEVTEIQKQSLNDPNEKVVSKTETKYENPSNLLPSSVVSTDLQGAVSTEVTYDQYDVKGNLQQYTTKDGISTVIVWGYNQTKPIAKIDGAKLTDIQQSLIDAIVTASNTDASAAANNDETSLLSVLNTFRNSLPNYQITTYTYDPLIGVRSITPPSGMREIYIYDSANRLKEIREKSYTGNLLKEFKYNYKQ